MFSYSTHILAYMFIRVQGEDCSHQTKVLLSFFQLFYLSFNVSLGSHKKQSSISCMLVSQLAVTSTPVFVSSCAGRQSYVTENMTVYEKLQNLSSISDRDLLFPSSDVAFSVVKIIETFPVIISWLLA